MTNQEADLLMQRALAGLTSKSGEESNGEAPENQSPMAIKKPDKYNFLVVIATVESNAEINKDKVANVTDPELTNCKPKCNEENLAMIVGACSYDKGNALLDTKVSFKQSKAKIHTYSKKKLESLLQVLIEAYLTICNSKEFLLKDFAH